MFGYKIKWLLKRFGFINRLLIEFKNKLIYQKKSQHILHFWNAHQTPFKCMLYFNILGRILWASKAFFVKDEIKLEGYEEIDYKKVDPYQILHPASPMSFDTNYLLTDSDIQKMERSFVKAYEIETDNFDRTVEWERIGSFIKDYFFDDNKKLIKNRIINFRSDNGLYEKVFNDQFGYLDFKNDSYTKSYLKSVDLVLEYHRFASKIDHTILSSISESRAGNNKCVVYRGNRISSKLLFHSVIVNDIIKTTNFNKENRINILDIGSGYGGLARMLYYYIPNSCYILLDLPETLVLTTYFIKYNFPNSKIGVLDDIIDRFEDFEDLMLEYDFIIITPTVLKYINSNSIDLVINSISFGFMQREYLDFYLSEIDRVLKKGGYFYSLNKEYDDKWGIGFFNWNFKSKYLTKLFEYNNRFSFAQWMGQKI